MRLRILCVFLNVKIGKMVPTHQMRWHDAPASQFAKASWDWINTPHSMIRSGLCNVSFVANSLNGFAKWVTNTHLTISLKKTSLLNGCLYIKKITTFFRKTHEQQEEMRNRCP